ncbi:PASTA domain-containing protein [Spirillospora albida]|uniref:PASTA domain-containing protein n=1 Tax=Spirillospora albida TaxID=58123 RepID=UPI000A0196D9|nr:PASTA domain-containing protein [Spirillospora albida]
MRTLPTLLAAASVALTAGCAGAGQPAAQVTVTERAPGPVVASSSAPKAAAPSSAEPSAKPKPPKVRVPRVVGMNHQKAQNIMQAAGFFLLREKDATGQDRMLLWDRNWIVVRQSPKPGTVVSTERMITLYSKKIGE